MSYQILAINPGSTSTKIAIFKDDVQEFVKNIQHTTEELARFKDVASQFQYRKEIILSELKQAGFNVNGLDAVVGRGGLVKPIESGIYEVNAAMIRDLEYPILGEHASNLGGLIAHDIVSSLSNKVKAYIADPVVVDEMGEVAKYSGHPAFKRVSVFHALNQKAIARTFAKERGKKYEELNLVVAHLGGGISVGAHSKGKVIDVNNALDGEGPFSPERSGTLPAGQLAKLCFSGEKSCEEVKRMINGEGGIVAYLGTNDTREVGERAATEPLCRMILDAMSYQIGKIIGAMAAVLKGNVDAILITGGIAYSKIVTENINEMVSFIAPVCIYPGEDEMRALAMNGLMVLKHEIIAKEYK